MASDKEVVSGGIDGSDSSDERTSEELKEARKAVADSMAIIVIDEWLKFNAIDLAKPSRMQYAIRNLPYYVSAAIRAYEGVVYDKGISYKGQE